MAIDSPLLRQREQENPPIAAQLKQKRLKIKAEIAEIDRETDEMMRETGQLRVWNAKIFIVLRDALVSKCTTSDA